MRPNNRGKAGKNYARNMPKPGMHSGNATDDAMNLAMSAKVVPLYDAVVRFINEEVEPVTAEFY